MEGPGEANGQDTAQPEPQEPQDPQLQPQEPGEVQPPHPDLSPFEAWWYHRYQWFKERGYLLRPRYSPGWSPSWIETKKSRWMCEDGRPSVYAARLLDATRLADGVHVVLKRVNKSVHPFEVEIAQFLSSEPLVGSSDNYCVPIYEVLRAPADEEIDIIVMPLLLHYIETPFDTIGEAVECFRQLFEGLLFMHKHRVAHRDCTSQNVMVDPTNVYIDAFHPDNPRMKRDYSGLARFRTRTEGRPRYILIDFGISRRFDPSVLEPRAPQIVAADKEAPEFLKSDEPCDPFPTDVFYIGNMIRKDFLETMKGLDFMRPLITDMVQEDPSKRPTMQQVTDRFQAIRADLKTRKLRSRVIMKKGESLLDSFIHSISHWMRRIRFMITGVPAVPTPSS